MNRMLHSFIDEYPPSIKKQFVLEQPDLDTLSPRRISELTEITIGSTVLEFVKELIENSIDSGASQIIIQIQNGGYSNISVTDNGYGIGKKNFPLLCQFHATSKSDIESETSSSAKQDTENKDSEGEKKRSKSEYAKKNLFGFHGTSLASISCSRPITITSRTRCEDKATKAVYHYSTLAGELQQVNANYGTKVELGNFIEAIDQSAPKLPSSSHNNQSIKKLVMAYAVVYSSINFRFISTGSTPQFESTATKGIVQSFKSIFNYDIPGSPFCPVVKHLAANSYDSLILLTAPGSNPTSPQISFFVDGQKIKHRKLKEVVRESYKEEGASVSPTAMILFSTNSDNKHTFIPSSYTFPHEGDMVKELKDAVINGIKELKTISGTKDVEFDISKFVKCYELERFPYSKSQDPYYQMQQQQQQSMQVPFYPQSAIYQPQNAAPKVTHASKGAEIRRFGPVVKHAQPKKITVAGPTTTNFVSQPQQRQPLPQQQPTIQTQIILNTSQPRTVQAYPIQQQKQQYQMQPQVIKQQAQAPKQIQVKSPLQQPLHIQVQPTPVQQQQIQFMTPGVYHPDQPKVMTQAKANNMPYVRKIIPK